MRKIRSVMSMVLALMMLLLCLSGLKFPTPVNAEDNNIYVSVTGNDQTGDGSQGNPYRTIYFGTRKLVEGQTLIVSGGIYGYDDGLWITQSGTAEKHVTVEAAPGEIVTITGNGKYGKMIYAAGVSYVDIKNINFYNVNSGSSIISSNQVTLDGCSFVNLPDIYNLTIVDSKFITVQNSIFDTNGGDLAPSSTGIGAGNGDAIANQGSSNCLIQNNYITKNGHYAITFFLSAGATSTCTGNVVRQNYIDEKWGGGIGAGNGPKYNLIEDNVIKNIGQYVIAYPKAALDIAGNDFLIRNNLLLSSSTGNVDCQPQFAFDGNTNTGWRSANTNSNWIAVDLGSVKSIDTVTFDWAPDFEDNDGFHHYYFSDYQILTSTDGQTWDIAMSKTGGTGGTDGKETISFNPMNARYVKLNGINMALDNGKYLGDGARLNEFGVYNSSDMTADLATGGLTSASSAAGYIDEAVALEAYLYNNTYLNNCIDNRLYNNVMYGNGGPAINLSQRNNATNTQNKIINNIMYKNRVNGYTSSGAPYLNFDTGGANINNKWSEFPNNNFVYNNLIMHADNITKYPGYGALFQNYDNLAESTSKDFLKSLDQVQSDYPSYFYGNIEADPMFTNEGTDDFSLASGSPAIDKGADLAKTTVAADTATTEVSVDDALFFTDGYGVVPGDMVKVGSNDPVRVTEVDYTTNTLTLDTAITYAKDDPVNLPYNGSKPDIGAIEYGSSSPFASVPATMPPANTLPATPVPTSKPVPTPTPTLDPNLGKLTIYDFHSSRVGNGPGKYTKSEGPETVHFGQQTDTWTVKVAKPYNLSNIYEDRGSPDSTIIYQFKGTKVTLYGERSITAGMAAISILDENGNEYVPEETVDCYADHDMDYEVLYTSPDLPVGIYSIKIRNLGNANDSAPFTQFDTDLQKMTPIYWTINLLKIEVLDSTITPTPKPTPTPTKEPTPSPVPTFSDVPNDRWSYNYITSLASKGIINGYSDGTFGPTNPIKRSEFMKIITIAFGAYDANSVCDNFSDVKSGDWYYSYVASAVASGLASSGGMGDGTFGAKLNMSREQIATFSARALVKYRNYSYLDTAERDSKLSKFTDSANISEYAKDAIALFVSNSVILGYSEDSTFRPKNDVTREEAATIMDKTLNLPDLTSN